MERRLPRVGEIWRAKLDGRAHIVITNYIVNKQKGDEVIYEILEQNNEQGVRYATVIMTHCDPVSYYDDANGVWIIKE